MAIWDKRETKSTPTSLVKEDERIAELEKKLASAENLNKILEGQNASFNYLQNELTEKLAVLSKAYSEIKPFYDEYVRQHGVLQNISPLPLSDDDKSALEKISAEDISFQQAQAELKALSRRCLELEGQLKSAKLSADQTEQEAVTHYKQKISKLEQDVDRLSERIRLLEEHKSKLEECNKRYAVTISTAKITFERMKEALAQKDRLDNGGTIDTEALREKDAQITALTTQISTLNANNTELLATTQEQATIIEELKTQVVSLTRQTADYKTLQTTMAAQNCELDNLREELEREKVLTANLRGDNQHYLEDLTDANQAVLDAEKRIEQLQQDIAELQTYKTALSEMQGLMQKFGGAN